MKIKILWKCTDEDEECDNEEVCYYSLEELKELIEGGLPACSECALDMTIQEISFDPPST